MRVRMLRNQKCRRVDLVASTGFGRNRDVPVSIMAKLTVFQVGKHRISLIRQDAMNHTVDPSTGPQTKDQAGLFFGAAIERRAHTKSSVIAPNGHSPALGNLETRVPYQRAVGKNPEVMIGAINDLWHRRSQRGRTA